METRDKAMDAALVTGSSVVGASAKMFAWHDFWATAVCVLTAVLLALRILDWVVKRTGIWWGRARRFKAKGLAEHGRRGVGRGEGDDEDVDVGEP